MASTYDFEGPIHGLFPLVEAKGILEQLHTDIVKKIKGPFMTYTRRLIIYLFSTDQKILN